jgi:hypothetical protein
MRNNKVEEEYGRWVERLVQEGWKPYLLTFMFRDIDGPPDVVAHTMKQEVERVYATLLTRTVRNPTRPSMVRRLPRWFCALDRPVYKRAKLSLHDVLVNDGLHVHAVALLPPRSRLSEGLDTHFEQFASMYLRPKCPLIRIDAVPITHRVGYVTGYGRKHVKRSVKEPDFILPRSLSEVRDSPLSASDVLPVFPPLITRVRGDHRARLAL